MLNNAKALVRMLRLRALSTIVLFACLGFVTERVTLESVLYKLAIVTLILACWYLNGTCVNDLSDIEIDKINLKGAVGRPLANERVKPGLIKLYGVIAAVLCVLVSLSISVSACLICVVALVLNWVYSMPPIRLSGRGVVAPLLLPLGYVVLPFSLAVLSIDTDFNAWRIWLLSGLYITFSGRIVLKDFRDIIGDRKFGKRTFIVRYGVRRTVIYSAVMFSVGSIIVGALMWASSIFLSLILVGHLLVILWLIARLNKTNESKRQQVIIGSVARIATTSILCVILFLGYGFSHITGLMMYILVFALYGVYQSLYVVVKDTDIKVVY